MALTMSTESAVALLPMDHPERRLLSDEVHARPPEALSAPMRASHIALILAPERRALEIAHLEALCVMYRAAAPAPDATQFTVDLERLRLKWERHGEFSTYTVFASGLETTPFAEPAVTLLPAVSVPSTS